MGGIELYFSDEDDPDIELYLKCQRAYTAAAQDFAWVYCAFVVTSERVRLVDGEDGLGLEALGFRPPGGDDEAKAGDDDDARDGHGERRGEAHQVRRHQASQA